MKWRSTKSAFKSTKLFGIEPDDVNLRFGLVDALEGARVHSRMRTVDVGVVLSSLEWTMARLEVWPESHWPGFALRQANVFQSYAA